MKYLLILLMIVTFSAQAENKDSLDLTDLQIKNLVTAELTRRPESVKQFVKEMIFLYPSKKKVIISSALSVPGINPADVVAPTESAPSTFYTNKPAVNHPAYVPQQYNKSASPN